MSTTDAWLSSVALYKSLKRSGDIHQLQQAVADLEQVIEQERAINQKWINSYNNLRHAYATFASVFQLMRRELRHVDPQNPLVSDPDLVERIGEAASAAVRKENRTNAAVEVGRSWVLPERAGGSPLSIPEYQALVDDLKTRLASAEKLLADAGVAQAQPVSNATLLARISGNQT